MRKFSCKTIQRRPAPDVLPPDKDNIKMMLARSSVGGFVLAPVVLPPKAEGASGRKGEEIGRSAPIGRMEARLLYLEGASPDHQTEAQISIDPLPSTLDCPAPLLAHSPVPIPRTATGEGNGAARLFSLRSLAQAQARNRRLRLAYRNGAKREAGVAQW